MTRVLSSPTRFSMSAFAEERTTLSSLGKLAPQWDLKVAVLANAGTGTRRIFKTLCLLGVPSLHLDSSCLRCAGGPLEASAACALASSRQTDYRSRIADLPPAHVEMTALFQLAKACAQPGTPTVPSHPTLIRTPTLTLTLTLTRYQMPALHRASNCMAVCVYRRHLSIATHGTGRRGWLTTCRRWLPGRRWRSWALRMRTC